ncbi:MAG: HAD hydrolase-like protein [Planctomycetia bacterium]|nr:HAD hydrolase-like protein [Planctomycetia bacterium]
MKIKHIIWDWNGTLLNDNWLSIKAINILLAKYGLPLITKEKYLEIFTFPVIDYYKKLGFDFDKTPFNIVGTEFIDEYTNQMYKVKLHDGAYEILNYFHETKVSQSLLSAAKQQMLDELSDYYKLNKYFIKILGINNHYADSKLHIGEAWVEELQLELDEVLFVGDTLHDLDVAREIGTDCILIAQGHTSYHRLKGNGTLVFYNLFEFKDWFIKNEKIN